MVWLVLILTRTVLVSIWKVIGSFWVSHVQPNVVLVVTALWRSGNSGMHHCSEVDSIGRSGCLMPLYFDGIAGVCFMARSGSFRSLSLLSLPPSGNSGIALISPWFAGFIFDDRL